MPLAKTDTESMVAISQRRHPQYNENLAHWDFCESTYNGGREWFLDNIHQGPKEGDTFGARVKRAYRFNHTREVVDLIDKYIFKTTIARKDDASPALKAFWLKATRGGLDIDQFMRLCSGNTSKLGIVWVFVDSKRTQTNATVEDDKKAGNLVYAYAVKPQNILDASFDEEGQPNWVLVRETERDDVDPISSTGQVRERFRLWMRDAWYLWRIIERRDEKNPKAEPKFDVELTEGENKLKRVPGFPLTHVISEDRYASPALINDIAYLDKAVANYLSNIDAIIQDQTFSQLTMPAQNLLPGQEAYDALVKMGTNRVFIYDAGPDGSKGPAYISPDPKQAGMILTMISKIVQEIYHSIGVGGQRTETDNAASTDASAASGVAKAYDFERLNSLLVTKSKSLENAENEIAELVSLYNGEKAPEEDLVKYPDTFDVRSLYDEFTIAEKLVLVEAPDAVRREQMTQVIEKLFPSVAKAIKDKMIAELAEWPKDPIEQAGLLADVTAAATAKHAPPPVPAGGKPASGSKTKNSATANRQGEVTAESGKKAA